MTATKNHAPTRRNGQTPPASLKTEFFAFRLKPEEKAKLLKLGGANWIRNKLKEEN